MTGRCPGRPHARGQGSIMGIVSSRGFRLNCRAFPYGVHQFKKYTPIDLLLCYLRILLFY